MTKINLNTPPYFDDYNENKKFYKILFRPGRPVQARELTQLQSILQNQISRLGRHTFKEKALVYPHGSNGFRFTNNTVFVKVISNSSTASLTFTKEQIQTHWLGKDVESQYGVKGTVVGYNMFETTGGNKVLRLYLDLKEASPNIVDGVVKKNFGRGDTIYVGAGQTRLSTTVETGDYSVGRICKIKVPKSIYYWNDYFVLVDEQEIFLEPDSLIDETAWTNRITSKVSIKLVESIVDSTDDESLLDNSSGSTNYGGIGADRLKIDASLVKRSDINIVEQNTIHILTIEDGIVTEAPLVEKDQLDIPSDIQAKRTFEESGNYTVIPFIADTRPFMRDNTGNRGLYTERTLSFGYSTEEEDENKGEARRKALDVAEDLFRMETPATVEHTISGETRFYPGTSYDDAGDSTSFKSLCDSMVGVRIDPGTAYVQGYRVARTTPENIAVKKARTSDFIPNKKIHTPLGNYILITNVFGCPEIGGLRPYDDIELHSEILDLSTNHPSPPTTDSKVGTARLASLDLYSGSSGSKNAVYRMTFFDLKLVSGKQYSDIKSIYSNSKTEDGSTFLANLVLKTPAEYPSLIFTGSINKVASAYTFPTPSAGQSRPSISVDQSNTRVLKMSFDNSSTGIAQRDVCFESLTVGTAVQLNGVPSLVKIITSIENDDSSYPGIVPDTEAGREASSTTANGTVTTFSFGNNIVDNDTLKVYTVTGSTTTPITKVIQVGDLDATLETPTGEINGINQVYSLDNTPIETSTERINIIITEPLDANAANVINGSNRVFKLSNTPINGVVELRQSVDGTSYTVVDASKYTVTGYTLTFKTSDNNPIAPPPTGAKLQAKYATYVYDVNGKSITLPKPPYYIANAVPERTSLKAKYKYNSYTVNENNITFATTPGVGTVVKASYKYFLAKGLKVTVNENINTSTISALKVVKKVRGVGTLWKSNPGQYVEKGDWVSIGAGDNQSLYQVVSTPANDNEINLEPDPMVDGNAPWSSGANMVYLTPEDIQDVEDRSSSGFIYSLPHNMIQTIRGGEKNVPSGDIETTYVAKRYEAKKWEYSNTSSDVEFTAADKEVFATFSSDKFSLIDLNTGMWFQLFSSSVSEGILGELDPTKPESFKAIVIVDRESNTSKVTFKLPSGNNIDLPRRVLAVLPIEKRLSAAKEGTKTVKTSSIVSAPTTDKISLGKTDIYRIVSIVESSGPTVEPVDGGPNRKDYFTLDDGQTNYYYGIGSVKLRHGAPRPAGKLKITFEYFEHTESRDYFSVDSYTDIPYENIPTYVTNGGIEFDLKGCLDFRPTINDLEPQTFGVDNYSKYRELPVQDVVCSYHVYETRKDRVYISKDNKIVVKEGTPGIIDSYLPEEPIDGLTIYTAEVIPYTSSHDEIILTMHNNRRYTMKDIAKIETRVKNLEYYTSLSLLEKDTTEMVIKDALGQDKFKHGFLVEPFDSDAGGNRYHPDSTAAIDKKAGELKPRFAENVVELKESALFLNSLDNQTSPVDIKTFRRTKNYTRSDEDDATKTSAVYTIDYKHVTFIEQPLCSRLININPYAVQSFVGSLKINPWTDSWRETKIAEPKIVQDSSAWLASRQGFNENNEKIDWFSTQTEWSGEWAETGRNRNTAVLQVLSATDHWPARDGRYLNHRGEWVNGTGIPKGDGGNVMIPPGLHGAGTIVPYRARGAAAARYQELVTFTQKGYRYRDGLKWSFQDLGYSNPISLDNTNGNGKVINIVAAEYIRTKEIGFDGRGFLPNTQLYAFFDNQDVTQFCYPDVGYGTVVEDPNNTLLAFNTTKAQMKFTANKLHTSHDSTLARFVGHVNYNYIADASNGQTDCLLIGTISASGDTITGVGTQFVKEIVLGTDGVVLVTENGNEIRVIQVINDTTARLSVAISPGTTITAQKAANKTASLRKIYVGKYVDVSNSDDDSRNILNKRIMSLTYLPDTTTDTLTTPGKLNFILDEQVSINPTLLESVYLVIRKTSTSSSGMGARQINLKCDSTGKIKGRFCIPEPTGTNPKFRTGDRVFRLTNSIKNELLPTVSKADAGYTARGWLDVYQKSFFQTRNFTIHSNPIQSERTAVTQTMVQEKWSESCPMDPVAQSFTVKDENGIFLTAVDVFFFSRDPNLPVTLQIRPLADGGTPSSRVIYEMSMDASDVVANKVDIVNQRLTVIGAKSTPTNPENGKIGFNKGPWNVSSNEGIYAVNSRAFENSIANVTKTPEIIQDGVPYNYTTSGSVEKDVANHMIPTRFVFEYPIHLRGKNANYCFVLLSDSVPPPFAGPDALEDTYQVFFAQTGKVSDHDSLATPIHRTTPLEPGEDDLNLSLGTSELITTIPQSDGQLFKSQNGISWVGDPRADLKYKLHKAEFNTSRNAHIDFMNEALPYAPLRLDPFQLKSGSSLVRVYHRNHGMTTGSKVMFTGVEGDLNGISAEYLMTNAHTIENVSLDSYVIDLGDNNIAEFSSNIGGANVLSTRNIRFEEINLIANPLVLPGTSLTWSLSAVTGAGPSQDPNEAYLRTQAISIEPDVLLPFDHSMQVCSSVNENTRLNSITPDAPSAFAKKSLLLTATLKSTDPNVSPVVDTERLTTSVKTVRIDDNYGLGGVSNLNNDVFDLYPCLPTAMLPGGALVNAIFFSDTDNLLTGSSFIIDGKKVTGVGSLFTVELAVGDVVSTTILGETEERTVVEVINDTTIMLNDTFTGAAGSEQLATLRTLRYNTPNLKIKTANPNIALELSKLDIGKYLTLTGTTKTNPTDTVGMRNLSDKMVLEVNYTPNETAEDPELGAPKLCEIVIAHTLPDGTSAGFEQSATMIFTQKDRFIDEISPAGGSSASKYVSRELLLNAPANTLKVMFDGCRLGDSKIELYYKTHAKQDDDVFFQKPWIKMEYSLENNGLLTYTAPDANTSKYSFSAYEANTLQSRPFVIAQVKVVLKGNDPALYPKIKNLRIIALEE